MYEDIINTHVIMRDYSEANRLLDSLLQFTTDSGAVYYWKIGLILLDKGDIQAARQLLVEAATHLDPVNILWNPWRVGPNILGLWRFDLLEGDLQELPNRLATNFVSSRKHLYYANMAEIYRLLNQPDSAKTFYDSARAFLEDKVQDYPDEYHYNAELSIIYMMLGKIEEAKEVGLRAKELLTFDDCHW